MERKWGSQMRVTYLGNFSALIFLRSQCAPCPWFLLKPPYTLKPGFTCCLKSGPTSQSCCDKWPQSGWFKTTEIYPFMVLEARSLKLRCWQGGFPPEVLERESPPHASLLCLSTKSLLPLQRAFSLCLCLFVWISSSYKDTLSSTTSSWLIRSKTYFQLRSYFEVEVAWIWKANSSPSTNSLELGSTFETIKQE